MEIEFTRVAPILRIFDVVEADEFCLGFLGVSVDGDHRFDAGAPLYRRISRGNLILHLSEHHGDGSPGARVRVAMRGVGAFHREISFERIEPPAAPIVTLAYGRSGPPLPRNTGSSP